MNTRKHSEEEILNLVQLARLRRISDSYSHYGQEYILMHLTENSPSLFRGENHRFEGYTIIIAVKGEITVTIDLDRIEVPQGSVVFVAPERVLCPIEWSGQEVDAYLLFLSNRFVYEMNIDLNALRTNIFITAKSVLKLSEPQIDLLIRYFGMLHDNARQGGAYARQIATQLTSAAAYQIMAFSESDRAAVSGGKQSRKMAYVQTFLRLVRVHYKRERSVGFYADKMYISAKYLSQIVKEETGRYAPEWIEQYVIREAKNLLRYSGKNVSQVAAELNFPNQSSFGKYFKHLTGFPPSKFQKS